MILDGDLGVNVNDGMCLRMSNGFGMYLNGVKCFLGYAGVLDVY